MKSPHLLRASSNVRRLKDNLVNVVDRAAIDAIEAEICVNVAQLYVFGRNHYLFAIRQGGRFWRQKISRFYYCVYNVSRAVRLCASGEYSAEMTDHKKVDALPKDFPNVNTYVNRLGVLREDRNMCDYDHTAQRGDLLLTVDEATQLATDFLRDAHAYLRQRGVQI